MNEPSPRTAKSDHAVFEKEESNSADLISVIENGDEGRWTAFKALGQKEDEQSKNFLIQQLVIGDWTHRRAAIEALATRHCEVIADRIAGLLSDPSEYVLRTALDAVRCCVIRRSHDRVAALLSSTDESTVFSAVRALGAIWEPEDCRLVFGLHQSSRSVRLRKEAGYVLAQTAGPTNYKELVLYWMEHPQPYFRTVACELIDKFAASDLRHVLVKLQDDPDGHVRKAARKAAESIEV